MKTLQGKTNRKKVKCTTIQVWVTVRIKRMIKVKDGAKVEGG